MACVRRVGKRWVADYRDAQGKRHREFCRIKREAEDLLAKRLEEIGQGRFNADGRKITFATFAQGWLEAKSASWAPNTLDIHRNSVHRYLCHADFGLGRYRVANIDLRAVEGFKAALMEHSPHLSHRTVNLVLTSLGAIMKHAVRHGLRSTNPVEFVDRLPQKRKEITPLTPVQVEALMANAKALDEQQAAIVQLGLYTGMRLGEILALRWRDVDLPGMHLSIHGTNSHKSQRARFQDAGSFGNTKTDQSLRRIKLSATGAQVLREHRMLTGNPAPTALVFANSKGLPLDPSNFRDRFWNSLVKAEGLPKGFTFHSLRHTYASHMLSCGAPVEFVQRQLGHSSYQTTLSVYRHWIPDRDDLHADIIEAALASSGQ